MNPIPDELNYSFFSVPNGGKTGFGSKTKLLESRWVIIVSFKGDSEDDDGLAVCEHENKRSCCEDDG